MKTMGDNRANEGSRYGDGVKGLRFNSETSDERAEVIALINKKYWEYYLFNIMLLQT